MRSKISLFIVFLLAVTFITAPVYAWPFGSSKKAEAKTSNLGVSAQQSSQAAPVPSQSAAKKESTAVQEDTFFDEDADNNEAPIIPQLPKIPKSNVPGLPQLPQVKYASVAKETIPAAPSSKGVDPDIARIQKQIQEIMKINESLKSNFSGQAAEIQKISDQAKIHGEILKNLDNTKKIAEEANAEKYLNKEKLRVIQDETEKNQKYLQDLNKQKETATASNPKASSLIPVDSNKTV